MINFLGDKLSNVLDKIKGNTMISDNNIEDVLHEIKIAFLESDINYKITIKFLNKLKETLKGKKIKNKYKNELVVDAMQKEMLAILDNKNYKLKIDKKPTFWMIAGLQGSGKTTTIAKLANYFQLEKKKKVLVVTCDTYRPAAHFQLKKICKKINVKVIYLTKSSPEEIAKYGIKYSYEENYDLVIFDTAGRIVHDEKMMKEIVGLQKIIKPKEIILNIDAMSGQSIYEVANEFKNNLNLTSAVLTKFDSETRSGAAFTISYDLKLPIVFLGVGEKISDLEVYHPKRLVKQILGEGDLATLAEKASKTFDEKESEAAVLSLLKGKLNLQTIIKQLENINKIGSFRSITRLIPGIKPITLQQQDKLTKNLDIIKHISNSATNEERNNLKLFSILSRKNRILKGCGLNHNQYAVFLKYINNFQKQSKKIKQVIENPKLLGQLFGKN